ncbi:MAG: polyprenyl synthetase family protein [Planctomycetales bacterium]|nr:polyprenyl synthetase family protein [Planctomycetales bacterium]
MVESATTPFKTQTVRFQELVNLKLAEYCQIGAGCPERLEGAISYSLLAPGKRLRPVLCMAASQICGGSVDTALPAACAIEMVHAYSLIHDDLPAMDDDDLRRGLPTSHIKFGEATAILAGDALLTRAFEVMASDVKPAESAARCCRILALAAGPAGMVGGQSDDLAAESQNAPNQNNIEALEHIHRRKTGALLVASLEIGATVAGATTEQIDCLRSYGANLGLAFQIVDDLLDLTGDESTIGKKPGQDVHRGKLTYPQLLGEEKSRQYASELIEQAILSLNIFGTEGAYLDELARFVLERNR